jgi:hypothetical protein
MTRLRLLLVLVALLILVFLGAGAGAWWYLFGANSVQAADLVPSDTIAFATIPNGASVLAGYETSNLKTLVEAPNAKPLSDLILSFLGQKNADLITAFLPNLSGQSFVAITHFDADKPESVGLIAAMKPKAGLGNFDSFVEKLKTTWPDLLRLAKTGTDSVDGVEYQWIQETGSPEKICVAQVKGWIVTSWGVASLQDWLERFQKKSATPTLAQNPDYQKSLTRVGKDPATLLYVNYHAFLEILQKEMAKTNPAAGDYFSKRFGSVGGAAMGSGFENGEIVDRFSFLLPREAQLNSGMGVSPCPFETLKFTGPDTRFYWASSIDWKQYYKNLQDQPGVHATPNPVVSSAINALQTWAQGAGIDVQKNIIDPLGSEFSVQVEWSPDTTYPEIGFFAKLDKPDDFKPAIAAIINTVRSTYETSAVIRELNSNGQNLAVLKFIQTAPISPTMTEDGPYFGLFLTENQAVRSFQRDETIGLPHNADFVRQIGDKRNGASQLLVLDSPRLLDRAYRTALPYLSLAGLFNKDLAALLNGKSLPPDLTWLAPMGTWSFVASPDDDGIQGYSVSGIGNQGLFLGAALGGATTMLQSMGYLPKTPGYFGTTHMPGTPPGTSAVLQLQSPGAQQSGANLKINSSPNPAPGSGSETNSAADSGPRSIVHITSDGKIFFDDAPVASDQFGDFLKAKKAANEDLKLTVKVDPNADPAILSHVMDAGAQAGFGVLPVTFTSNAPLPTTNSTSTLAPSPEAATNVPAAISNSETAPPVLETTNAAPTANSNSDATPATPGPAPTQ